jgi:hypothetical protein
VYSQAHLFMQSGKYKTWRVQVTGWQTERSQRLGTGLTFPRMVGLILTWLLCSSPALSQETPSLPVSLSEDWSAADSLEAAKAEYFAGGHARALASLTQIIDRLNNISPPDPTILAEAEVYRAEIQYVTEDRAASWASFVRVLEQMPDYQISTFLHPAEVVDWFELVRRETSSGSTNVLPPTPRITRPPARAYAPFGTPQFGQHQPGAGIAFAGTQVATAAASIGLHLHMRTWRRRIADTGTADDFRRFDRVRFGVQLPVTVAFYALYVASVLNGRRHFARSQAVEATIWLDIEERQLGVALRF